VLRAAPSRYALAVSDWPGSGWLGSRGLMAAVGRAPGSRRQTADTRRFAEEPAPRAPRGNGRWWIALVVVLIVAGTLTGVGIWAVNKFGSLSNIFTASGCTASSTAGSVSLDLQQAQNASTIAAVGIQQGVPVFGIEVAEATAMQESKLHNLGYGDRDSVGLFQQRPSQGWGTAAQIMDPVYSSTKFYQALVNVSGWQSMTLTQAAQAVQKSGAPDAYAAHQADATVVASVFTGTAGAGLGCTLDGPTFAAQSKSSGALLTARAQSVLNALRDQFGAANVGAVSGVTPDGLSFDVSAPSSLSGTDATNRGWAFANWLAAQAETSGITRVQYADRSWSSTAGADGWATTSPAGAGAAVHVTVTAGT
jgi:hypothetical protein